MTLTPMSVVTLTLLARVLDLYTVDADESKHRPEQTEQCTRQPGKQNNVTLTADHKADHCSRHLWIFYQ